MPKSTKPRHKMRPILRPITPEDVRNLREVFETFETACHIKLPLGTLDKDEVMVVKDMYNVFNAGLSTRRWLDQEEVAAAKPEIHDTGMAIHDLIQRGARTGRYVAKGEEIKKIRSGMQMIGPYLQDCLDTNPRLLIREIIAMKRLLRGRGDVVWLPDTDVKKAIDTLYIPKREASS